VFLLREIEGIARVAQDTPTDAQDHGSVSPGQRLEGCGVRPGAETLKKLRVGVPRDHTLGEQVSDMSQGSAQCFDGHVSKSP